MAQSPVEEELFRFGGHPGGAHLATWQLRPNAQAHTGQHARIPHQRPLFPQPSSAAGALLELQTKLLGRLLTVVSESEQLAVLDLMAAAVAEAPPRSKGRKALDLHQV